MLAAGKIIEVISKSKPDNRCFVKPDNLSESVVKIAVGNKYLAVLRDVSNVYSYVISTFKLDDCEWTGTHSRSVTNSSLFNISTSYYNLTECNGDF